MRFSNFFRPDNAAFGADLAALNVQRGRDHEVGSYAQLRSYCGLQPLPTSFDNEDQIPPEISLETWRRLSTVYEFPEDIELFPGGLNEISEESGKLGPTFSCIIGEQFRNLKFGDRFFFTHNNTEVGFCENDLEILRQRSLRDVICDNTDITELPRDVFRVESDENPVLPCNDNFRSMDPENLCLFGAKVNAGSLKSTAYISKNDGKYFQKAIEKDHVLYRVHILLLNASSVNMEHMKTPIINRFLKKNCPVLRPYFS